MGQVEENFGKPFSHFASQMRDVDVQKLQVCVPVAEVLVVLATDTTVDGIQREEALKVNELTFIIRASDSSWHPGLPGRPVIPCEPDARRCRPEAAGAHTSPDAGVCVR